MSVLSRLRDPSHWINRIVFVLALVTLEILAIGLIGLVMPFWMWSFLPSMSALIMISFWCSIVGIVLLDERRQPHRAMIATGILPGAQTPIMVLRGVLWALAMLSPMAIVGIALGGEFTMETPAVPPLVVLSIVIASVGEEVLFRSTMLRVLQERFGAGWAILATSVFFSLAHNWNPSASLISGLNTFLIGVAFGSVIAIGGSIWVAAASHAAWNVLVALFFGTVSGNDVGLVWIRFIQNGSSSISPLLMGDTYGIESGLLCTAVITISLLLIRHIVVVDPYVIAARYRVAFNKGRSDVNPNTAMESTNVA